MVGYLKKGFKYYSKTNPTLHNNGFSKLNPNNSDEVARNLGVTIIFCSFKVLNGTIERFKIENYRQKFKNLSNLPYEL